MGTIADTSAWKKLQQHYQEVADLKMKDLFVDDSKRFNNFSVTTAGLLLDYSKNRITATTMQLLEQLTATVDLKKHIEAMFAGELINTTEQRAVLHTALRNPNPPAEVKATLEKICNCAEDIRQGKWKGYSKKAITDVVNIGIGGSDLGPAMVVSALTPYAASNVKCHFVANVDGTHITETLKYLNPETTLFIVASKTFTTQETLCNASTAREWLAQKMKIKQVVKHLIAVTANPERAVDFGIDASNVFPFWDWVGGRYSLWSAIGLAIAIAIGADNFCEFLAGAYAMDEHFRRAPFTKNMPVILALIGIWNNNFLGAKTQAILPYDQYLHLLPAYLQQLEMESNGKRVTMAGEPVTYNTAPVIWGSVGTNGQHAFHQLLMQGTQMVPADFILPLKSHNPIGQHQLLLVANCLAQSQALMQGRTQAEVYKVVPGNNPSNTILIDKITPATLGSLIALYEHKVFVQGIIWGINSFDQWGVELGKQLTKDIIPALQGSETAKEFDASTKGLIKRYLFNLS